MDAEKIASCWLATPLAIGIHPRTYRRSMLRPLKFSVILSKLRLPKANRAPRRIHPYHRVAFPLILQTGFRVDASLKANPLNCPNSMDWLAQHDNPKQRNMLRPCP